MILPFLLTWLGVKILKVSAESCTESLSWLPILNSLFLLATCTCARSPAFHALRGNKAQSSWSHQDVAADVCDSVRGRNSRATEKVEVTSLPAHPPWQGTDLLGVILTGRTTLKLSGTTVGARKGGMRQEAPASLLSPRDLHREVRSNQPRAPSCSPIPMSVLSTGHCEPGLQAKH